MIKGLYIDLYIFSKTSP